MVNYATVSQKESSYQRNKPSLIITCEHAGNHVPEKYNYLFESHNEILDSHLGYDIGALNLTMFVTRKIQVPVFVYPFTRLLVEINRSEWNQKLFSKIVNVLSGNEKSKIIENYYRPYRSNIERQVENALEMTSGVNFVWHISIHTFTPVLNNKIRKADIGILYDPASALESGVSALLREELLERGEKWIVRRNYPYLGKSDGFTTYLRKQFGRERYCGIELEVNQKYALDTRSEDWMNLKKTIAHSIDAVWNKVGVSAG